MGRPISYRVWTGKEMIYTGDNVVPSLFKDVPRKYFSPVTVYHNKIWAWFYQTQYGPSKPDDFDYIVYIDAVEFMESTGIYDKNKKQIFEGDVVVEESNPKDEMCVTFYKSCFYTIGEKNVNYRLGGWKPDSLLIIGNIYENANRYLHTH